MPEPAPLDLGAARLVFGQFELIGHEHVARAASAMPGSVWTARDRV